MFYQNLKHLLLISLDENTLREEKIAKEKKCEIKECEWVAKKFMKCGIKECEQLIVFGNAKLQIAIHRFFVKCKKTKIARFYLKIGKI